MGIVSRTKVEMKNEYICPSIINSVEIKMC